jgi:outer membrane receptor for ferrienterochelin and colicin
MLFLLSINTIIFSQEKVLDKTITIDFHNKNFGSIIREIESQAGCSFVYSPDIIDVERKTSITAKQVKLNNCLDLLFKNTGIEYSINGNQVILKKKRQSTKKVVSGYLEDATNGERLIFATIADQGSQTFASSNQYGFYSLNVPDGPCILTYSYIGFKPIKIIFNVANDTSINLQMFADTTAMKDVVVFDNPEIRNLKSSQTGINLVSMKSLKAQPSLLGEADLIKNLQSLPGIQSGLEGSNTLYIRGGDPDQNLFLLDGITVYNINHAFGFFSVFNSEAIQNTTLYKSGFPARYGGRLSSVVDMKLKEGNSKKLEAKFSIGTLSAKAEVEGPIGKRASFYFSARRTYLDLITKPIVNYLNKHSKDSTKVQFDASFYDIISKVNYQVSDKSKLYLSVYLGKDIYALGDESNTIMNSADINWGNITSALRWNYKHSGKLFSNTTVTYSRFYLFVNSTINGIDTLHRKIILDTKFDSYVDDWALKYDAEYYLSDVQSIQAGAGTVLHDFNKGTSMNKINIDDYKNQIDINNSLPYSSESYVYAEDAIDITKRLRITPGLRVSYLYSDKNTYGTIDPRLNARYLISDKWAIKSSYARMSQFLHMMNIGKPSVLNFELWFPSDKYLKPKYSSQLALGVNYSPKANWEISVEAYNKQLSNLLNQKFITEGSTSIIDSNNFTYAKGEVYGFELFIQKRSGRINGWASYTLSQSTRKQSDLLGPIEYKQEYTHKHLLNINVQINITSRIDIFALMCYGSGASVTFPIQAYQSVYGYLGNAYNINKYSNYNLTPYHRLDLGLNFTTRKKYYESVWNFSVYNAYNQQNPNFIEIRNNKFIKYSYFAIIPSISYTIKL